MRLGIIRRLTPMLVVVWPLLGLGQAPQDPTRPPDSPIVNGVVASAIHCVEMTMVAADRKVAMVDGVRLREGEELGLAVIREISATGVSVEENGVLRRYFTGNCPSPRQSRE